MKLELGLEMVVISLGQFGMLYCGFYGVHETILFWVINVFRLCKVSKFCF